MLKGRSKEKRKREIQRKRGRGKMCFRLKEAGAVVDRGKQLEIDYKKRALSI